VKVAYYPGCSAETSGKEYEISSKMVCKKLGIELVEVHDWSCCGATAAHSTDHLLALALAGRNLALVEKMGLPVVTAPCSACYQRLALTQAELAHDKNMLEQINQLTGYDYKGTVKVSPILEVIAGLDEEQIKAQIVKPMKGLRIAAYYGCMLLRPSAVKIDDPENPQMMDKVLQLTGGEVVEWSHKSECCGASLSVSNEDIVKTLTAKIFRAAVMAGANCIATACPLCQLNLDYYQEKVNQEMGTNYNLSIFYFTQLLGLAMGLDEKEMGIDTHFTDAWGLIKQVG